MKLSLRDACLAILFVILAGGCAGEDSAPEEPAPAPAKQEKAEPKPDSSAPELIPPEVEKGKEQSQMERCESAIEIASDSESRSVIVPVPVETDGAASCGLSGLPA